MQYTICQYGTSFCENSIIQSSTSIVTKTKKNFKSLSPVPMISTLSLILVIPLPRLEPVLYFLDEVYTVVTVYLRYGVSEIDAPRDAGTFPNSPPSFVMNHDGSARCITHVFYAAWKAIVRKLFSWLYCLVLSPLLTFLTPVLKWIINKFLTFETMIRGLAPLCKVLLLRLVPSFILTVLSKLSGTVFTIPLLWARSIYWFINGPLRWIHLLFSHVKNFYDHDSNENSPVSLPRYFVMLLLSVGALIIALPSPVSALNYLVTGYGYPGSTIRFHYCPDLRKTNLISYLFLEISYPLWNITRTVNFYLFSKYLFNGSWRIQVNIKNQIGPGYSTWLMGYGRMFCVGLLTPFVLPFQCFGQVINNILCTLCHIAFLTILNGHTRVNFFMVYYGVCSICVHVESTLVALASTLHSLRLTVNDHVTTIICTMELYLMIHVSWLTCKIIWRKIKSPDEDVLWKLHSQ